MSTVDEIIVIVETMPEREQRAFLETIKLVRDDSSRLRLMDEARENSCRDFASVFDYVLDHA